MMKWKLFSSNEVGSASTTCSALAHAVLRKVLSLTTLPWHITPLPEASSVSGSAVKSRCHPRQTDPLLNVEASATRDGCTAGRRPATFCGSRAVAPHVGRGRLLAAEFPLLNTTFQVLHRNEVVWSLAATRTSQLCHS